MGWAGSCGLSNPSPCRPDKAPQSGLRRRRRNGCSQGRCFWGDVMPQRTEDRTLRGQRIHGPGASVLVDEAAMIARPVSTTQIEGQTMSSMWIFRPPRPHDVASLTMTGYVRPHSSLSAKIRFAGHVKRNTRSIFRSPISRKRSASAGAHLAEFNACPSRNVGLARVGDERGLPRQPLGWCPGAGSPRSGIERGNSSVQDSSSKPWNFRRDEAIAFLALGAVSLSVWGLSFLMTPAVLS